MSTALPDHSTLDYLFGGDRSWDFDSWQASDDRVRGGKSQSYLEPGSSPQSKQQHARFHGDLDISTLGGAGFASQRTSDSKSWDLSSPQYTGLRVQVAKGDGKKYTLILKDEVLPRRPDGREQSTVSWEYDFIGGESGGVQSVTWADFKPTYRGKAKPDAAPLDLKNIKRISIMMRSFFGTQEGAFDLELVYMAAMRSAETTSTSARHATESAAISQPQSREEGVSWLGWVRGWFRGVL
ncbi:CIA30 family protein-like protein [Microdochium bolleyi]|uniref:CIA30 family protein-like protein n=1 Tax=Microdochium bolleyi TaxID=196109 RepID=A0A136JHV8_9PEZI|nr:CIA30 family protein-like protein [Microdochium bolleyi]